MGHHLEPTCRDSDLGHRTVFTTPSKQRGVNPVNPGVAGQALDVWNEVDVYPRSGLGYPAWLCQSIAMEAMAHRNSGFTRTW